MKTSLRFLLLLPALLGAAEKEAPHVRADLLADTPAVVAGTPFTVALRLRHDPHWHTYWKNPGDAGLATGLKWTLPPGFTAGPLQWPTPHRIGDETVMNYGYDGETLLLIDVTPPAVLPSKEVRLAAAVQWLECNDICLPGKDDLALTLPTATAPRAPDAAVAQIFSAARARLPLPAGFIAAEAGLHDGRLWVKLPAQSDTLDFFPDDQNRFAAPKDRKTWRAGAGTVVSYAAGDLSGAGGVLTGLAIRPEGWRGPGSETGAAVETPLSAAPPPGSEDALGLWTALLLSFLGGTVLNLMPCVLPVLSLKILGFVNKAGDPAAARRDGALYSLGVMASFWALAALLLALRAGGARLGWGFQLQSPVVVGALMVLFTAMALNLFGLFEVGVSLTRLGGVSAGAFGSGVLAVIVATPCTAPFMGTALGWAVTQPAATALAVFTALGVGMAWPYALLSASPRLLRFVPKPGPWMIRLKKFLGILLLGTALWLGWVLARQTGLRGAGAPDARWEPYSAARVIEERRAGRPVLVDFTADWCLTCQVNERTTLKDASVLSAFQERNVALFKADWTHRDEAVTQALADLGRNGVPVYALYPADPVAAPTLMPALLTPGIVLDHLKKLNKENHP